MQIFSDYRKDHATPDKEPGGYEWWYFDAIDPDSGFALVVIFYEGNPFSNRYVRSMEQEGREQPVPENFPAVSISIYWDDVPLFYSFSEYDWGQARFDRSKPELEIGSHELALDLSGDRLLYRLHLEETLAGGDRIEAELEFASPISKLAFTGNDNRNQSKGHTWNLVQPRATVKGSIWLFEKSKLNHEIAFRGTGYHDHNTGQEPMRNEFRDWYWGRFHFPDFTLVYYIMNRKKEAQHRAWLFDRGNSKVVSEFRKADLNDKSFTLFGLKPAHKVKLLNEDSRILVQQNQVLDNGPFYRRYLSEAFLHLEGEAVQTTRGISEYIYPARIYRKVFWPFVDMRIRYKKEEPHWVQKSRWLYRWTW